MTTKTCTKCHEAKPLASFCINKRVPDGHNRQCRRCKRASDALYRKKHPEHSAWRSMLCRCNNATDDSYRYYGARGITVCVRWRQFATFLADMGRRPTAKHQIDRIDTDGDYEPSNCRWVTVTENNRNKRCGKLNRSLVRSIIWHHSFGNMSQVDIADAFGISGATAHCVIRGKAWAESTD